MPIVNRVAALSDEMGFRHYVAIQQSWDTGVRKGVTPGITRAEHNESAILLPAQLVDATQALNLSAGVSNCKVSRGRSFS